MTVLGINYLNASITAIVVVYVFVCLAMILLVLMQRPKQEGLGAAFGANTTDQLFGARTTNVLQKGTVYLAVMFFVLTLTLGILVQKKNRINSLAKPAETAEAVAPAAEPAKSLSDELPVTPPVEPTPAPDAPKPAEDKPAENQPTEDKPADPAPVVEPGTGDKPEEEKPADPATGGEPAEGDKTPPP